MLATVQQPNSSCQILCSNTDQVSTFLIMYDAYYPRDIYESVYLCIISNKNTYSILKGKICKSFCYNITISFTILYTKEREWTCNKNNSHIFMNTKQKLLCIKSYEQKGQVVGSKKSLFSPTGLGILSYSHIRL